MDYTCQQDAVRWEWATLRIPAIVRGSISIYKANVVERGGIKRIWVAFIFSDRSRIGMSLFRALYIQ